MNESPNEPCPTGIAHDRPQRQLLIAWNDGHEGVYPLDMLRAICPCDSCRGGDDEMGTEHEPDILTLAPSGSCVLKDLQLVGNSLQLWWEDGHTSGFYTWALLRSNCACETCLAERRQAQPGDGRVNSQEQPEEQKVEGLDV